MKRIQSNEEIQKRLKRKQEFQHLIGNLEKLPKLGIANNPPCSICGITLIKSYKTLIKGKVSIVCKKCKQQKEAEIAAMLQLEQEVLI